jgi:hypothetical protein
VKDDRKVRGSGFGSWKAPPGDLAGGLTGGTVYCTALAILTLETFYRYQPYLARFDLRAKEEPEQVKKPPDGQPPANPPAGNG